MNNYPSASSTPVVSPLDIALATSATSHLSMNQAPFHPYSPVVAASPSVAFSNLSLRTPHRTIPASLPPTPKLTGASPQISTPLHAFATPELPSASLPASSSNNPKNLTSLRSNYKKMRRESNANRRTEMLPPSEIPIQSPLLPQMQQPAVVMEDWVDFTTFMQEVGNGTPPMLDSHSPSVGPAPLPMNTTPVLGAEETWDLLKMIDPGNGNATLPSPTIQHPLESSTPFSSGNTSGFQQSPAVHMPDELSAYFNHNGAGPSSGSPANYSDVLSSPTHVPSVGPSPRVPQWHEFPLFSADPSPPVNPKTFTPVSSGGPTLSQESVTSSSTSQTSNSLSVPPPRASMSPNLPKRPRLSLDGGQGHRRNLSSSSSAAPSPYIGAGSSSTKPTGYRRHMQPSDLTSLDAPTQKRNYAVPSVTSRKDFPPSVTKSLTSPSPRGSKRTSAAAGLPTRDDTEMADHGGSSGSDSLDTDELKQAIEEKRRANTIAARKSRLRKAEFLTGLQLQIKELQTENDQLRQRAEAAEQRAEFAEQQLRHLGVQMPSF